MLPETNLLKSFFFLQSLKSLAMMQKFPGGNGELLPESYYTTKKCVLYGQRIPGYTIDKS